MWRRRLGMMRKISLIILDEGNPQYLLPFEQSLKEIGFEVETIKVPCQWKYGRSYVNDLTALLKKKSLEHYVIFFPSSSELFLKDADLTIAYSAYRSWFDPRKTRIIPHLDNPVRPPAAIENLKWMRKPPLRIGFMGRAFADSRLANAVLKSPVKFKRWLSRGSYVRHTNAIALMNDLGFSIKAIGGVPQIETLRILNDRRNENKDIELEIVERTKFEASEREIDEYIGHLERSTYIICPRGTENYSYRVYETLSRGRIPVIIDTDVVLPKEINWGDLSIIVPYEFLHKIYDLVRLDYNSRSEWEFAVRQNKAFSSMAELQTMSWMRSLATKVKLACNAFGLHPVPKALS